MLSQRMTELLRSAAADLRKGIAPLGHEFLVEHDVTLDEAYGLAEWMAVGCDTLLELNKTGPGQRLIGVALASEALASGA